MQELLYFDQLHYIFRQLQNKMIIDPYTYYKIIFDINLHNQRGWAMAVSDDASSDYYDSSSRKVWIGKLYSNWKIIHVGSGNWQFILIGGKYEGWKLAIQTSPKEKNLSWVKLVNGDYTGTYWTFVTPDKQFNDVSRLIIQNTYNNQYLCAHRGRNEWKRNGESTFLITHANIKMGADQLIWNIQANGGSSIEEKKNLSNAQIIQNLQGKLTKAEQNLTYYQRRCESLQEELNQTSQSYQTKVGNLTQALHQVTQKANKLTEQYTITNNDALKYRQLYKQQQESLEKKSKEFDQLLSNFYQYKNALEDNQQENQMSLEALKSYMEAKELLQSENRQMRDQLISLRNQNKVLNQQVDQHQTEIQKHKQRHSNLQNQLETMTWERRAQQRNLKNSIQSAEWKLKSALDQSKQFQADFQSKHKNIKKNYQIKANYFRDRLAQTMKPSASNMLIDFLKENQLNQLSDQNAKLRQLLEAHNIQIPAEDNSWLNSNEQQHSSYAQQNQQPLQDIGFLGSIFGKKKQQDNQHQNIIDKLQNQYKVYLADADKRQQIQRERQWKQSADQLNQMQMNWNPYMTLPKIKSWWINYSHPELVYKNSLVRNVLEDDDIKRIALTNTHFHPFNNPKPNVWLTFKITKLKAWMGIGIIQCPQTLNFDSKWCVFDHKQIVQSSGSQSGYNDYMRMMGMNMEEFAQSSDKETIQVISPQKRTFYMLTSSEQLYNLKAGNSTVTDAPFKFKTGDEITIYYNSMRGSVLFEKEKESFEIRNVDIHPGQNYAFVAIMEGLGSAVDIKDYDS